MRKFHSIAALCGDGLRPELRALFERLAVNPNSELFIRTDGMTQSGPEPSHSEADQHMVKLTETRSRPRPIRVHPDKER